MTENMAKLVRKIESGKEWYFDKYEIECLECGRHYFSGRYDRRTCPYCSDCKRKHDKIRMKENKEKKQKELYKSIRNKAIDDFVEAIDKEDRKECLVLDMLEIKHIAEQLKAGGENE